MPDIKKRESYCFKDYTENQYYTFARGEIAEINKKLRIWVIFIVFLYMPFFTWLLDVLWFEPISASAAKKYNLQDLCANHPAECEPHTHPYMLWFYAIGFCVLFAIALWDMNGIRRRANSKVKEGLRGEDQFLARSQIS